MQDEATQAVAAGNASPDLFDPDAFRAFLNKDLDGTFDPNSTTSCAVAQYLKLRGITDVFVCDDRYNAGRHPYWANYGNHIMPPAFAAVASLRAADYGEDVVTFRDALSVFNNASGPV